MGKRTFMPFCLVSATHVLCLFRSVFLINFFPKMRSLLRQRMNKYLVPFHISVFHRIQQ